MNSKQFTFRDGEGQSKIYKLPVEALTFCFDFGPRLAEDETLEDCGATSTTFKEPEGGGTAAPLVLSNIEINEEEFTDESDEGSPPVLEEEGVKVKMAGGTRGAQYELEVFATDSDGDVKAGRILVEVI